ncbi:MAG TPA: helix-turn-helix domain-containing protein [Nocardioidaceae bacterium]|nr:helix-turn-helix domain-containing protein [Nocardioidaceae bacterium]
MAAIAGTWEITRPRVPLPGVVDAIGYRSMGVTPGIHRGLPSPYLTFVISIDGPIVASWEERDVVEGTAPGAPTVLGGLHTAPAYLDRPESEAGVQLAVHPLAARAIFGLPAAELAGQTITIDDVWGCESVHLREQLEQADDWETRFEVLRNALAGRIGDQPPGPRDDVAEAWRLLASEEGNVSVTDLAAHVHLGNRQLTEVVRREVGLSPKRIGRLMRFHSVVRRLSGPTSAVSLAETASQQGYADQAHLTREFVEFTGIPPTEWLEKELRFVQDNGEQSGAFWPS